MTKTFCSGLCQTKDCNFEFGREMKSGELVDLNCVTGLRETYREESRSFTVGCSDECRALCCCWKSGFANIVLTLPNIFSRTSWD